MSKGAWLAAIGCCAAACSSTPVVDLGEERFVRFGAVHDVMLGSPLAPGDRDYHAAERPRTVTLGEFEMSKHLVTVQEYWLFLNSAFAKQRDWILFVNASSWLWHECPLTLGPFGLGMRPDCADCPVDQATWFGAMMYCEWLTERGDGWCYSLPMEWEWEYAARGGHGRPWPWGQEDPTPEHGWSWAARPWLLSWPVPHLMMLPVPVRVGMPPVATHPRGATPEGVHDMLGYCAWEWCADEYLALPVDGPHPVTSFEPLSVSWYVSAAAKMLALKGRVEPMCVVRGGPYQSLVGDSLFHWLGHEPRPPSRVWSRWALDPNEHAMFRVVRRRA